MDKKIDKKKKAAISAVIAYLNEQENKNIENKWVKLGRVLMMRNNITVQTKKIK